jgi:predicted transcriptional regulator
MTDVLNHRPAPTVDALLKLLAHDPAGNGITTAELAQRMGKSKATVSSRLSRMRAYGYVTRTPEPRIPGNTPCPTDVVRWKLRERR